MPYRVRRRLLPRNDSSLSSRLSRQVPPVCDLLCCGVFQIRAVENIQLVSEKHVAIILRQI